jgi:hypothetical protein
MKDGMPSYAGSSPKSTRIIPGTDAQTTAV